MPTPFAGAAATEATAVPWHSRRPVHRLVVEERRIRPTGELRVRRVDAAVDDRERDARPGRRRRVCADVVQPPLLALERLVRQAARRRGGRAAPHSAAIERR